MVEYLFGLVDTEASTVRMNAQECLNAVGRALQQPDAEMAESVYQLLFRSARSQVRRVAVRHRKAGDQSCRSHDCLVAGQSVHLKESALVWARTVFPFADAHARLVCIICMDDPRSDLKESARKGLQVRQHPLPTRTLWLTLCLCWPTCVVV